MRRQFKNEKDAARQTMEKQDVKCIPLEEVDYEALFFKTSEVKTRNGKVVYIRKEFHDRILKIVRVIGENDLSLFSYLDNVLEYHFTMFQDDITQLYRKKNTDIF